MADKRSAVGGNLEQMLRGLARRGTALTDFADSERFGARKTVFFPFQLARKPFTLYHGRFEFSRPFVRADLWRITLADQRGVQCEFRDAHKLLRHLRFRLFFSGMVAGCWLGVGRLLIVWLLALGIDYLRKRWFLRV